jgi:mRNA-degrading endonuclease RelE of RelBE toxin-antitoxin system
MFSIYLSSNAESFLKKSPKDLKDRILKKIKHLSEDPFPSDSKRIVGRDEKIFRIRVGDYRIQYVVFYDKKEVLISDIDKRERAYD